MNLDLQLLKLDFRDLKTLFKLISEVKMKVKWDSTEILNHCKIILI